MNWLELADAARAHGLTADAIISRARRGRIKRRRKEGGRWEYESPSNVPESHEDAIRKKAPRSKRYVIAYAQNLTPVHAGFLASLENYCRRQDAKLLVIPGLYRNPTRPQDEQRAETWWDPRVKQYLYNGRKRLGDITIFGDISIQPTAKWPLSGMDQISDRGGGCFGHPTIEMRTVPTSTRTPRMLFSTGAITEANYSDSKVGKQSEHRHTLGALVVEVGKRTHVRQIECKDPSGAFSVLDTRYLPSGKTKKIKAAALVLGDTHEAYEDRVASRCVGEMIRTLRPEYTVVHDLLHFRARSHHAIGKPRELAKLVRDGGGSVEIEVKNALGWVDSLPKCTKPVVVRSNHDEHFDRWLTRNPLEDPINVEFWCAVNAAVYREHRLTGRFPDALAACYEASGGKRTRFLTREDSFVVAGVECAFHGDAGINGARGSVSSYARLGVPTVTGHGHSARIMGPAWRGGVTGLTNQGYNRRPTTWTQSCVVIYEDGARCMLSILDGEWRS